ncbi:MAG: saccharopine dehydrogenase family protein [Solirubrobacteraceae bacterium]
MEGKRLQVAVLGAGGTIAPAIVHDLAESDEVGELLLLDLEEARASEVANAHGAGKARAEELDARDPTAFTAALEAVDVLVNAASYRINLEAMQACLDAGCHYLDLGGLYWMTHRQLELGGSFERAGRLAILGIGSSPGKTNLMALRGVQELGGPAGGIESVDVAAASRDPEASDDGRLRPPYAIQTLLDELTLEPIVIRDGETVPVAPLTPGGTVDFGDPIGPAETILTLHSEMATFGGSFGCRTGSFRLSLAGALRQALQDLLGATPEDVERAARESEPQSDQTVSVHMVSVQAQDGRRCTVRSVTRPHFGMGGSIVSTATPAAAAVRLLARGSLTATGVHPPEGCIDPHEMFDELSARGCTITVQA